VPTPPSRILLDHAAAILVASGLTPALGGGIDLARVCVVTPGRRLGRLLLGRLTQLAAAQGRWLSPPRLATPVQLPEIVLGAPELPTAGAMQRALAWRRALAAEPDALADSALVIGAGRDVQIDDGRWIDDTVSKLARAMVLPGEVPTRCTAVTVQGDDERWAALDRVRDRYEGLLAEAGLCDPRLKELRRLRAKAEVSLDAPERIVLVGVLELDRAARAALEVFEKAERRSPPPGPLALGAGEREARRRHDHATADRRIVVVSPGDGDGLDAHGTVSPDRASEGHQTPVIELQDDQLAWSGGPGEAAAFAIDTIAGWHADGAVESSGDVVICSPGVALTRELEIAAAGVDGFAIHDAAGVALSTTGVGRLVHALVEFLRRGDRISLARLAKHGAVHRVIGPGCEQTLTPDWVRAMDAEATESPRTRVATGDCVCDRVAAVLRGVVDLSDAVPRRLREQMVRLGVGLGVLLDGEIDADAAKALAGTITQVGECEALLEEPVALADAAELLLDALASAVRAAEGVASAVDVLGWLDAAYDPAPNLVLLGFNSGIMPARPGADAWLSETVLRALGMFTSEHAAARDAYLLRHMLETRRGGGRVCAIVASDDGEGSALWPSPFVFACDDATAMRRAERMSAGQRTRAAATAARLGAAPVEDEHAFPVAPVTENRPVRAMSVTAFKDYMASPYLFYLKHSLRVREEGEPDRESGYDTLGTFVHDLLRDFAASEQRDSVDAEAIKAWLLEQLRERATEWPKSLVSTTAELQRTVLERRLSRFAELQALHRAEGWQISATEWKPDVPVTLKTSRGEVELRGRIDRIDRRGGAVMVIDYKTSDRKKKASQAYKRRKKDELGEWRDLQLPLYRYMLLRSGFLTAGAGAYDGEWVLGYWPLCKDRERPEIVTLKVGTEDFEEAERHAVEIVERVLGGEFAPLGDPEDYGGSFSRICGLRLLKGDDEEAAG
jgi:ATP-dependent helicase/nuclease subunit B